MLIDMLIDLAVKGQYNILIGSETYTNRELFFKTGVVWTPTEHKAEQLCGLGWEFIHRRPSTSRGRLSAASQLQAIIAAAPAHPVPSVTSAARRSGGVRGATWKKNTKSSQGLFEESSARLGVVSAPSLMNFL